MYTLQRVLLGFDDTQSIHLLQNCRDAMGTNSRLLIIEQVRPPPGAVSSVEGFFDGTISNVNMVVVLPGRERAEEYRRILDRAGLKLTRPVPTQSLMRIIEEVRP